MAGEVTYLVYLLFGCGTSLKLSNCCDYPKFDLVRFMDYTLFLSELEPSILRIYELLASTLNTIELNTEFVVLTMYVCM